MSAEFSPIANIQTERIRTQIELPYNLEERIGLNTKYLHTLIQMAGIRHVAIKTKHGETSQTEVHINQINPDGSTIANQVKTKEIDTHSEDLTPDNSDVNSKHLLWPYLTITLNTDELRERALILSANNYQELKSGKTFTKEIDKAIKQAVRKTGEKNLIQTPMTFGDKLFLIGGTCSLIGLIISFHTHDFFWMTIDTINLSARPAVMALNKENFQKGKGYRPSLIPGVELERFLLLQAYSRIKPVVIPLDKTK